MSYKEIPLNQLPMIRCLNSRDKIILVVSHDFEFLGRTCDKIFHMEGRAAEGR